MAVKKIGILLCNIGTPEQPTVKAVRRYLKEFLSDPRIVKFPRLLWWFILRLFILPTRPRRSAHAYQKIWLENGSPLLIITQEQVEKLTQILSKQYGDQCKVLLGMRHGAPSIAAGLRQLKQENCDQVLIFPLYPQYSTATTESTLDAVNNEIKKWHQPPEIRWINNYFSDQHYLQATIEHITQHWQRNDKQHLLFSFHGLPQTFITAGDPYAEQCHATVKELVTRLNLSDGEWSIAFQSRLGPAAWLQPYCDQTLREMPTKGIKHVTVFCPGFAADCLETLEEIAMQNKEIFFAAGGESFHYIPALNASTTHIHALTKIAEQHLQGWL
jgi:ferrochelatase